MSFGYKNGSAASGPNSDGQSRALGRPGQATDGGTVTRTAPEGPPEGPESPPPLPVVIPRHTRRREGRREGPPRRSADRPAGKQK